MDDSRVKNLFLCVVAMLLATTHNVDAHPLGMSSVNRYAGVRLHPREIEVDYLIDYAELPAYAEIESLDADHDGAVTSVERDTYVDHYLQRLLPVLDVRVEGVRVSFHKTFHGMEAPEGQNGLSTLRVAIELRGPLPETVPARCVVTVRDTLYSERNGWRELAADDAPGGRVVGSTVPNGPRAGARLVYPTQPGATLLRMNEGRFEFDRSQVGTNAGRSWIQRITQRVTDNREGARLVDALKNPHKSLSFVLFALALAFGLGAGHALSPGHGKTLVAASLVGTQGKIKHAVILGASVTVAHTASVFVLGMLVLLAEHTLGTDKILRTLELASGVLVMGLALSQLPARWRRFRTTDAVPESQSVHDTDHHDHHHHTVADGLSLRSLVALGASGGVVPCPGALVVLLAAVGLHQVAFGMLLIVAFSLGLASVLTVIGAVFVMARARFERLSTNGRLFRVLPVVSSCAVLMLGAVMIVRSLTRGAL
jgi:nickel/cobalt transporter (NicO) family protein